MELVDQLTSLNTAIYNHEKAETEPAADEVYKTQIEPALTRFVRAAGQELGARKTRKPRFW